MTFVADETANCRQGADIDLWFAHYQHQRDRAKDICNGTDKNGPRQPCPFLAKCLDYALHTQEAGVWGGLDEKDRARIARDNGWTYERPRIPGLLPYGLSRDIPHGTSVGVEQHRRRYMALCPACAAFDAERKGRAS